MQRGGSIIDSQHKTCSTFIHILNHFTKVGEVPIAALVDSLFCGIRCFLVYSLNNASLGVFKSFKHTGGRDSTLMRCNSPARSIHLWCCFAQIRVKEFLHPRASIHIGYPISLIFFCDFFLIEIQPLRLDFN